SGLITASAAVTIAPAARREIDALLTPFPCQCADVFGRNAGFVFLPLWRFRDAVLFAEQIGFPLVEAHRVCLDIIFVVEAFLDRITMPVPNSFPASASRRSRRHRSRWPWRSPMCGST